MIFRNLAQGIKIVQSALAQMVSIAISDGRQWGLPVERLDEIRAGLMPCRRMLEGLGNGDHEVSNLPRLNLLRAIRCPHERALGVLRQVLDRFTRVVGAFGGDDPALWDVVNAEALAREVFNELQAARETWRAEPANGKLLRGDDAMHGPPAAGGMTAAYLVDQYLLSLEARVKTGRYGRDGYSNVVRELRLFKEEFGTRAVNDFRQFDLTKWLEENPSWKSIHTKKRIVAGLLSCFRWGEREGLVDKCPFHFPVEMRGEPYKGRRTAEVGEYVKLMCGGSKSLRRALFFLRRTGCRTCEMRGLLWEHVVLDGDSPYVSIPTHKTSFKTGRPRKFGLDRGTARFLANLKRQAPAYQKHVFVNCDGEPWSRHVFARHFRRWAERLGLDGGATKNVSAYCLRHLYAVQAIEAGISTRQIADQLGHARTDQIDTVYGVHTRQREKHLSDVASEITLKRNRNTKKESQ